MEVEEVVSSLADQAKKIHVGDLSKSTTGIAELTDGTLVAATQVSVEAVKEKAKKEGILLADVMQTYGAGYHCEVSLFIKYGGKIKSMGASQGFCPHCQAFLSFKGITMDGPTRKTLDQVWRSPEFMAGKEVPKGATYPWVYLKIEPENERMEFATKAAYDAWYKKRVGE